MEVHSRCYLCDSESSVETNKGSGGNRFDVLCLSQCPQYEIARGAIEYLVAHTAHRSEAIADVRKIAVSGKFPVLMTTGVPTKLHYTSRQGEGHVRKLS